MSKMIKGITIEFNKEDNSYFENCYEDTINPNILIISLLETINDICIDFKLDINEKLSKYIEIGSIDNYMGDFEEQQIKNFQTELNQKDQRIAELECDLENLTVYDLKKSHEYSIKILMQANENLSKQIAELKIENNEFCDYNKKLREEKQTAVKEFADELNEWAKNIASNSFGAGGSIHYNTFLIKLVELLKERGIE